MNTAVQAASAVSKEVEKYRKAVGRERKNRKERPGREPFLRMAKDGVWTFGKENIEVQDGSLWAIHPDGYKFGWTCWTRYEDVLGKDSKKKDKKLGLVMVEMGADPIDPDTLERFCYDKKGKPIHIDADDVAEAKKQEAKVKGEWDWKECVELQFLCVSGEDKGKKAVYNSSSSGGLDFGEDWLEMFTEQLYTGSDDLMAVGALTHSTYPSKQWGKTYKPEFDFDAWWPLPKPGVDAAPPSGDAPAIEGPKDKKPKKDKKKKDKKADAAPPADAPGDDGKGNAPAPTRRRRRPD